MFSSGFYFTVCLFTLICWFSWLLLVITVCCLRIDSCLIVCCVFYICLFVIIVVCLVFGVACVLLDMGSYFVLVIGLYWWYACLGLWCGWTHC